MIQNFSLICQISDFGSGQIRNPVTNYLSPELAKIASLVNGTANFYLIVK
jgi:hypothetical protein